MVDKSTTRISSTGHNDSPNLLNTLSITTLKTLVILRINPSSRQFYNWWRFNGLFIVVITVFNSLVCYYLRRNSGDHGDYGKKFAHSYKVTGTKTQLYCLAGSLFLPGDPNKLTTITNVLFYSSPFGGRIFRSMSANSCCRTPVFRIWRTQAFLPSPTSTDSQWHLPLWITISK